MKSFLLIYSTVDGHTKNISKEIGSHIKENFDVTIMSIDEVTQKTLIDHDRVLIGASIRYGKYRANVFKFIKENINILRDKSAAFFSVNVVARKKEKNLPETNPYIIKFLKQTQWVPSYIGVFAGKVEYPKYGFFDKYTIRFIMWLTKGPTDITQSYEFTDWKAVESFSSLISS
mgnify:FL=1